ncbi:MFS transporter [Alicyclobacillus cellulosilyticus]|uniref:MFS transporter n=1 Tax=Alicyclobacillus cellulosilyticus TaxID=1003997 RepID=A0A917KH98_9BACL|nr:MFS transporter [Alicyclobacillus cellulosilyticus]GGJ12243.1 MFS transporter [Alicyclobacillus cellulosilyticus]
MAEANAWQRTLWVMAVVQCIMMMAFSSSGPFLALYVEQLGVKSPQAVDMWTGLIASANFLMSAVMSPVWGAVADRRGRKLMVMRATIAIALFTCGMGLCRNVWELLATRMLQGAFSGYSAAAVALVATLVPEEKLGFALGWLQSAAMIGSLTGPLVGGLVSDWVHSYRVVFFLTSGFACAAFFITWLCIREAFAPPREPIRRKPSLIEQFRAVRALRSVRAMFLVLFVAQFSVMSVQPVLPVFVKALTSHTGHLGTLAGSAFAITGLADLIASPFLGKRSDTLGYRRVLTICMTGAALCYLPQAWATSIWMFIAARFGLGLFVGGIIPTANALVGRSVPSAQRGQVYGFTSSATFLGSFAGPLLGGLGSAVFGIRWMLGFVCALYLLNMLWVRWQVVDPPRAPASNVAQETQGER